MKKVEYKTLPKALTAEDGSYTAKSRRRAKSAALDAANVFAERNARRYQMVCQYVGKIRTGDVHYMDSILNRFNYEYVYKHFFGKRPAEQYKPLGF